MMPHFFQKAQQVGNRWLPPILAAVSLVATVDPASLAAAAECQFTEDGGMTPGMTTWKGATSSIVPLPITMERDIFGGFVPSPVREVAPYMKNSRITLGNTENHGIATNGVCLSQDILNSPLFNQAVIKSIGKSQANMRTQSIKISVLPYSGKRQVHTIRTTLPEVGVSARSKTATISGSVQGIQKPILFNERRVSQVIAGLPSTVESPSQFGGQPFVELNQFASSSQLPDNDIFRMNLATAQVLHSGNCPNGCP